MLLDLETALSPVIEINARDGARSTDALIKFGVHYIFIDYVNARPTPIRALMLDRPIHANPHENAAVRLNRDAEVRVLALQCFQIEIAVILFQAVNYHIKALLIAACHNECPKAARASLSEIETDQITAPARIAK
ncbi:hypothetical protein [Gibbsiella quercinecans]|uniref:hypothetical protein n=1 Tax=Gibbsiella quercinecans TaxID=929813 RepID=UPI0024332C09|nr:hypothetical protein [Gibbsiella quercinecans]